MFFTSPIVVYYANSFIADAPALGFALCGWYQLYRFNDSRKGSHLVFGQLLFLLGGLIKISSLYSWVALMAVVVLDKIRYYRGKPAFLHSHWKILIGAMGVSAGIFLWYSWSIAYNSKYMSGMFLQGILPVWDMTPERIEVVRILLYNEIMSSIFSPRALAVLVLAYIAMLILWNKTGTLSRELLLFSGIGLIAYGILFYSVFDVHDYYLVNHSIWIAMVLVSLVSFLERNYPRAASSVFTKLGFAIVLVLMANDCRVHMVHRLDYKYRDSQVDLYTLEPEMRNAGITLNDHVVVIPDNSINIGLYYCGTKGENDFGGEVDSVRLQEFKQKVDAKYLVALDDTIVHYRHLENSLGDVVLTHGKITVYTIR